MKVKTITCHDVCNLGASLQAFALQEYLKELGHDVQIINYKPGYQKWKPWYVSPRFDYPVVRWLYLLAKCPGRITVRRRARVFVNFNRKYFYLTEKRYEDVGELQKNAPEADVYIAGSDQIWNTDLPNGNDPAFYLDFGNARKVSYAASFATATLKLGTEAFVKQELRNFDDFSVREYAGVKLLQQLGYQGVRVVDPAFLHSSPWWAERCSDRSINIDHDYLLVYDFEQHSPIRGIARRLARLLDCEIWSVGSTRQLYAKRNFIYADPFDFVKLVSGAQCVLSNSFHGTAFAMIFQRDFFVVNRSDGLNLRMSDLLNAYGLSERIVDTNVSNDKLLSHIDYNHVSPHLAADIDFSKKWLTNAIMGNV